MWNHKWLALFSLCAALISGDDSALTRDLNLRPTRGGDDAVVVERGIDKKTAGDGDGTQTRIFTDNQELNAGIGGFLGGVGVALLASHLIKEGEKKKCYHRYKRDEDNQPRTRIFGLFEDKDKDYHCPPPPHHHHGYKEPAYRPPPTHAYHPRPTSPAYHPPPTTHHVYKPPPPPVYHPPTTHASSYKRPYQEPHRDEYYRPKPDYHRPDPHRDDYRRPEPHRDDYRRPEPHRDDYRKPYRDEHRPSSSSSYRDPHKDDYRPSSSSSYRDPHKDDYRRPPHRDDYYRPPPRRDDYRSSKETVVNYNAGKYTAKPSSSYVGDRDDRHRFSDSGFHPRSALRSAKAGDDGKKDEAKPVRSDAVRFGDK